jgi:hypothetical protein
VTGNVRKKVYGGAGMPLRRLIVLTSFVLAVAAVSPSAVLGKAGGSDRPVRGTSSSTTVIKIATGSGTNDGTGQATHLGKFTSHDDFTSFAIIGSTFSFTGTETDVAANGDILFSTFTGSGAFTSSTTSEIVAIQTVTRGTGRFADASGTLTSTIRGTTVSIVGSTVTTRNTFTTQGRISY